MLLEEEESNLSTVIVCMADWGFPMTFQGIRFIVKGYLDREGRRENRFEENLPSDDWVRGFLRRNKNLTVRLSENIKRCRAGVDSNCINAYFDNLEESLEGIPPGNLVNFDGTKFLG